MITLLVELHSLIFPFVPGSDTYTPFIVDVQFTNGIPFSRSFEVDFSKFYNTEDFFRFIDDAFKF